MNAVQFSAVAVALLGAVVPVLAARTPVPVSGERDPGCCQSSTNERQIVALKSPIITTCRIGETRAPVPPRGTPQEFRAGLSTKIDATLQVTLYPNLIPDSVILLQVDSQGNRMAVLGKMRGDGRHRDVPVDYTRYTAQPSLGPSVAAGEIFLAAEASYSGSPDCGQLDNNDHEIDAGIPTPTKAQWQAQDHVSSAADHYFDSRVAQVGPVQAREGLVNFLLSNYGPNGIIQRGLVVRAVVTRDGQSVWWTYNNGLNEGLAVAVPGVKGCGPIAKTKSAIGPWSDAEVRRMAKH